jgi:hypothetical protein
VQDHQWSWHIAQITTAAQRTGARGRKPAQTS